MYERLVDTLKIVLSFLNIVQHHIHVWHWQYDTEYDSMTRAGRGTSDTGQGGAQGADLTGRARATIEDLL